MTPPARLQAAIEILEAVLAGAPAERELTAWARRSRFAGSGDRAAVRDHVYDALRRLRSAAWLGGAGDVDLPAMSGRAVIAGLLRGQGIDPLPLFDGSRHGPAPLAAPDVPRLDTAPEGVRADMPDWLLAPLRASLGEAAEAVCETLRHRAPVHLRVNTRRTDRETLIATLAEAGIAAKAHPDVATAVVLEGAPRGLTALPAFREGAFELQDAGSQALVERLPLEPGMRVLDLCAGGGGKTLAMAAHADLDVFAHDAEPRRLRDLPDRAARAGVAVTVIEQPEAEAPFDLVVCDVPCSGSGAWRRQPEARWRLTQERLAALEATQRDILARAAPLVRPGGTLAYMTCSVLASENDAGARGIGGLEPGLLWSRQPDADGDGFHLTLLHRPA